MKKISFVLIMLAVLLVPFTTLAKSEKVKVYFFRGEGCSHCAEAEEFFKSIQDEYGKYFKIVDYEVWNDEDNADLMEEVAKVRGEEASGVPYIIIGDQSWNGYASDYDDAIKAKIKEQYAKDTKDRYDVMSYIDKNKKKDGSAKDIIALIIILLVAGGIGTGIYFTRKNTK